MVGPKLKRYIAVIVSNYGTAQEGTRDNAEFLVADDDKAVQEAHDWIPRSGKAQDGDFLIVSENGRSVKSIKLKVP
jgi:hypothetical protein